jgi:hypothetical protein
VIWWGGGYVLGLIFWLIRYWPPWLWVDLWALVGFRLAGESEHRKIGELEIQVQKLEERIDRLERRA